MKNADPALAEESEDAKGKAFATLFRRKIKATRKEIPFPALLKRRQPFVGIGQIKSLIDDPAIKVVSFDIFDTLLVRPALQPRDIFYLLDKKIQTEYGVNFIRIRWDAEARLGKKNARLEDIYRFIAATHGLDEDVAMRIMRDEIACEKALSSVRPDVRELYEAARAAGKRVIAASDMYLGSDILTDIISSHGLAFDAVYASCDHGARKDDGALYDLVLAREGVEPAEMVHIGDNWHSDYRQALEKKLVAVWVPSIRERVLGGEAACDALFKETVRADPLWSIFLGFALNRLYGAPTDKPVNIFRLDSLRQFAIQLLAPLLTAFGIYLHTSKDIQEKYPVIYFASRDGWLPYHIYEAMRKTLGGCPGKYFAAGRRGYFTLLADDFLSYAATFNNIKDPDTYTLHDFLKTYFSGQPVLEYLETRLSKAEKSLLFLKDRAASLEVLERHRDEIDAAFNEQRQHAIAYYRRTFADSPGRALIFDVGYSGSVSAALTTALGRAADKIYFWQVDSNKERDSQLGTATTTFFHLNLADPFHLLLEELLSPVEGGIIGWNADSEPVQEAFPAAEEFTCDAGELFAACRDYAEDFCAFLGNYARYALVHNADALMKMFKIIFEQAPFPNLEIFKNICFPDPVISNVSTSIQKKIDDGLHWGSTVAGTGFDHEANSILPRPRISERHKVGVHVHLYNIPQANDFIRYLQQFPVEFDLFLTITDGAFAPTIEKLFGRRLLPNLGRQEILVVPNRGRDVSPWLVALADRQQGYDFFCHTHSKASTYTSYGAAWRKYLLDNVLDHVAVATTFNIFEDDPEIGVLFPAAYPEVRDTHIKVGVPIYGSEVEYGMICDLLGRMGMRPEVCRAEFFYSMGTMMWYRPAALRPLFDLGLDFGEFPEEPIGVGGTLAHALERVPSIVAMRNGYKVRSLTLFPPEGGGA